MSVLWAVSIIENPSHSEGVAIPATDNLTLHPLTPVSPAPSTASTNFAGPGQPITYGQQLKKKKKRVLDSDDESRGVYKDERLRRTY